MNKFNMLMLKKSEKPTFYETINFVYSQIEMNVP